MTIAVSAKKLDIAGIIQGVGFRPFIYQLAGRHGLMGMVANTASGVTVHVEGTAEHLSSFCQSIIDHTPPLARITNIDTRDVLPVGYADFSIAESLGQAQRTTLISPDVAPCEECLQEIFDTSNRRFAYPFTNCTNCGPRYTIIDDIPYDRPNTSMKHFAMCGLCRAEYKNPADRRFHAQPNACPVCGPHVALYHADGKIVSGDPMAMALMLLKEGNIVAVKGLGGFHLAVDAGNSDAISRLRQKKCREEKPFALMCAGLDQVRMIAHVEPAEEKLLTSFQRPIVLLRKRPSDLIAPGVSPDNRYFGIMLPSTPLHHLLFAGNTFFALVMTSGNISEEPIAIENADAFSRLSNIADYYLAHNRDIYLRSDDSIIRHTGVSETLLRRSRGYAPVPIFLKKSMPQVLGCGAALKNTVCLTKGENAFLSQHIGDLENLRTLDFYSSTIDHMKRILDITPEIIAHDMHPDYLSTRYALEQIGVTHVPVQHHHAHVASCMAENGIDGKVIGLVFDGTGYGTDGAIWGGEVLIADQKAFDRMAHLAYVPMPGGEAAIKSPWRMGVSLLFNALGDNFRDTGLPFLKTYKTSDIDMIVRMMRKNINSPLTSSMGRLFDGVAAILGLYSHINFEGQAAMALENAACPDTVLLESDDVYPYILPEFSPSLNGSVAIPTHFIISGIVSDMQNKKSLSEISTRFHWTLIHKFSALCGRIRRFSGLNQVVLSGGVFQNTILLKGMTRMLGDMNFNVYSHSRVPTNDGGISLGQAVVAGTRDY